MNDSQKLAVAAAIESTPAATWPERRAQIDAVLSLEQCAETLGGARCEKVDGHTGQHWAGSPWTAPGDAVLWTYTDRATGELRAWTRRQQDAHEADCRRVSEILEAQQRPFHDMPIGGPGGD